MARKRQPGRGTTKTTKAKALAPVAPVEAESMHLRTARLYLAGHTFREIARSEGVTVAAINQRLQRMREAGVNLPHRGRVGDGINVEVINRALKLT